MRSWLLFMKKRPQNELSSFYMVEICGNAQLCHTELVDQEVACEVANEEEQDEDDKANYEDGEKRLATLL